MSAAAELRAAAERLRELAEDAHRASPAPWVVDPDWNLVRCADRMVVVDRSGTDHPAERADLAYIAVMHPGVALALAAVFEVWARMVDMDPDLLHRIGGEETLAVARAIGGETR
ncbi:hypothetical protein [Streptomyces phytophilus]|uniref:hypothetical protein n=1 Tax=Streptomyces phytophilus TaxID=722715 RepID=UPI0015F03D31|nr:hypothetical protein [Streptomyces phytophilus]